MAALNLREVARRVGLGTPSLYEYFCGRMALIDAVYRLGIWLYAAGREHLPSMGMTPASFWERVRAELLFLTVAPDPVQ